MSKVLIEEMRIPEESQEQKDGKHYIKRVEELMLNGQYPFFIEKIIKEVGFGGGHALEIGPGPLPMGFLLCKQTQWHVTGLEISKEITQLAIEQIKLMPQSIHYRMQRANAEQMPFADKSFDLIFSSGSLHHWLHPEKVMKEIERVLKPGGTVIIFDLNREFLGNQDELTCALQTIKEEYKEELIASLKAAYIPSEIYGILQKSETLSRWRRIQFEQYHTGEVMLNQGVLLKKALMRPVRIL